MANPDIEPWSPDPEVAPGTPPTLTTVGERGTSAFPGNANWTASGQRINGYMGEGTGVSYYQNETPTGIRGNAGTTYTREAANKDNPAVTIVVSAATLTPVHGNSDLLTATYSSSTATGYTSFLVNGAVVGNGPITAGVSTYSYTFPTAGSYTVTARDDDDNTVTSNTITVTAS